MMDSSSSDGLLPWFRDQEPSKIQLMLARANWTRDEYVDGEYEVWLHGDRDASTQGVFVPLDPSRSDYQRLYDRALRGLQQQIDPLSFQRLDALVTLLMDRSLAATEWHQETPTSPGTIPWVDGHGLFQSATKQLAAMAKATVEPKARFGHANSYVAREFLDSSILAPSGVGSYVLTALTPIRRQLFVSGSEDALERKKVRSIEAISVLRTFNSALESVSRALEESKSEDAAAALVASVRQGISHEFVSALLEFVAHSEGAIVVPAPARPQLQSREFSFTPGAAPVLEAAARKLAVEAESTFATITGFVTLMEHEPDSDDRLVRIVTTSRGNVRKVRLHLTEEAYERALAAHRDDIPVRLSGTLTRTGQYWRMDYPEEFRYLTSDEQARLENESPYESNLEDELLSTERRALPPGPVES